MENFHFSPRIINPKKIANVILFSADEKVRRSGKIIEKEMPWVNCVVLSDPLSVSDFISDKASVFVLDDMSMTFVDSVKIHKNNKDSVVILLSSNDQIHRLSPKEALEKFPYTGKADLIFAFNQTKYLPNQIIISVIRCAEDLLNIYAYSQERRFIFLIVDDEPRWFSQFLPALYEILGQRADVKVTRTYEETLQFLFGVEHESDIDKDHYLEKGYGDNVVCLITDVFYPRGLEQRSNAGVDLIRLVKAFYPRIPTIIASKAKEAEDLKDMAFILPKGDPGSLETFRNYIYDHTGLGDFFVRDKDGMEIYRAKHIIDLYSIIKQAQKETIKAHQLRNILENYGRKDSFSTWLYMHGFRELGDRLQPMNITGKEMISVLKGELKKEILRMKKTPIIIDDFEVFDLFGLLNALQKADPETIQPLSDSDTFSTWLDCKSYPELAEEVRPIHGSGKKSNYKIAGIVEKWIKIYAEREGPSRR
ncbi:MAG: hypothetical protein MUP98_19580 [Candidatus Aminicenantes bacterium]|nr:hypothetical protein [Candidatus Aminicenantes bacterium]